ncbi:MAG: SpoIID/LytB domain-containing protein [Flavobacteriales bacterium]
MLRIFTAFLWLAFLPQLALSQQEDIVRIGLNGGRSVSKAEVSRVEGSYQLIADGKTLRTLEAGQKLSFTASGELVVVMSGNAVIGKYKRVVVKGSTAGVLRLKVHAGKSTFERVYPDNLIVRSQAGKLYLVNEAWLDRYVEGVTEAESGKGHTLEYYKVQSLIARTYALANLHRHATQGFHLCDEVHCQAYKGKARFEPLIIEATAATKDQVLVDHNIKLITAAFHSNCGGQTLNAEHVWSKPLSYLVGRPDTFCLAMPNSQWEKRIKRSEWSSYLQKHAANGAQATTDSAFLHAYQPSMRPHFFADSSARVRMTSVRRDLGLRSAFFVVHEQGDSVRFMGRGFGHGVGLCQEGGMRMGQLGYDCRSILHYYYKDVHIIDRRQIRFFAD